MTHSLHSLIQELNTALEPHYESSMHAHTVAWWLLEGITKKKRSQLLLESSLTLSEAQEKQLKQWVHAHTIEQYPLQYLLGSVPFGPLEILVEAPTLIPRPETEEWCARLITALEPISKTPLRILDLCTGSGCIALWLAHALPQAQVYGIDIAHEALKLATRNAAHNNITNVRFLESDLFAALTQEDPFDLIVANPPYINPDVWHELSPMVSRWEDRTALVASQQGLEVIKNLLRYAPRHLTKQSSLTSHGVPRLLVEIGYDQGEIVRKLFIDAGFVTVKVLADSSQRDRVVSGW